MLLGELALMTDTVRPATATALEPATVIRISRTLFLKMLDGYPDAARRLRDSMAVRADQAARDMARARTAFGKLESP
jgi:CRP-like cAMP-binding protein